MAKSRKRKIAPKRKKLRLVFELMPNGESRSVQPHFLRKDYAWSGEVYTESETEVDVYGITADSPLSLGEFLQQVREELTTLVPDSAVSCGVKIFARC